MKLALLLQDFVEVRRGVASDPRTVVLHQGEVVDGFLEVVGIVHRVSPGQTKPVAKEVPWDGFRVERKGLCGKRRDQISIITTGRFGATASTTPSRTTTPDILFAPNTGGSRSVDPPAP